MVFNAKITSMRVDTPKVSPVIGMEQHVFLQIENIYYPILALIGIPGNLMAIVILSRGNCGLSKCITRYMVAMAVADLLVIIFDVVLYEINDTYFPHSFLHYTPVCSLIIALVFAAIDCSVWLTVAFTFDRYIAICCQKLSAKYCTERTAAIVIVTVVGLSFVQNIPIYFENEHLIIIDNVPWFCKVKSSLYSLPIWVAYFFFDIALTPLSPFLLIVLLNALTTRHILRASRIRKGLRGDGNTENCNDPEIVNRRKSIILLLSISSSFILLWMVTFVHYICTQFAGVEFMLTDYNDPFTIMEHTGYMLQRLSSCTNTFIYAVAQAKFRESLTNIVKYPFTLLVRFVKLWTTA
ncbi:probable G-protein coupled receptor 139 [Leucoraja erinacea]|uniref:probable G-protein coupled receptor 139 n=1 Tax=Leucoraja erinaceus TaxID=7782 RepID=UPI002454861C|nr:probable G-protein coupled receptor 139 [Leucoraja erinacea]